MNRNLLPLLAVLFFMTVLLAGCAKTSVNEILPDSSGEKHQVSFNITGYRQTEIPLSSVKKSSKADSKMNVGESGEGTVNADITRFDFFVYNSAGQLVERLSRNNEIYYSGRSNDVVFLLENDHYRLIAIGSMGGLTFGDTTDYSTAYLSPKPLVEEIFYKEYAFTVSGPSIETATVKMERIVSSLEVRNRSFPRQYIEGGLPIVFVNSVIRYPFDPQAEHKTYYSESEYVGFDHAGIVLPQVAGELLWNRPVDAIYEGLVLPDRSGSFDSRPYIFQPASRSGYFGGYYVEEVILKPNYKKILTGGGFGSIGGSFVTITADAEWEGTEEQDF